MESAKQGQYKKQIARKYFVRVHMSLIVAGTVGGGVLMSRLLWKAGMGSVMLRYALDVAGAYLMFLILVKLWLWYVHSGEVSTPGIDFDPEDVIDGVDMVADVSQQSVASSGGGGSWFSFPDIGLDVDGEGCLLILLFLALVFLVVLAGGYLVWMAPEILGEAAFDAVVAGSLARVASRAERAGWVVGVVRATIIPFAVVFAMTMVLAYFIQDLCPSASTLREAISCPERKHSTYNQRQNHHENSFPHATPVRGGVPGGVCRQVVRHCGNES
ncbi:MAG: hypothetical protein JST93_09385 [Acidobacteria bacterium]|nr:hypothetical protein [Acidobacteriota bacterium]